jgi:hypothetical protein
MCGKAKIALCAAFVLGIIFPALAANKHHNVTHTHRAIYNFVPGTISGGCPANGGPSCSNEGSAPPDSW